MNKQAGANKYEAKVVKKNMAGREKGLKWEKLEHIKNKILEAINRRQINYPKLRIKNIFLCL